MVIDKLFELVNDLAAELFLLPVAISNVGVIGGRFRVLDRFHHTLWAGNSFLNFYISSILLLKI